MGIDIYMKWHEHEKEKQLTGFEVSGRAGSHGYLREAYHGGPYAMKVLLHECWEQEQPEDRLSFSAATLRERLPDAIDAAVIRYKLIYNEDDASEMAEALTQFVELAERKEKETGQPVTVYASY